MSRAINNFYLWQLEWIWPWANQQLSMVNFETHSLGNQIGYGSGLGPKVEPTCRRPIQQTNQPLIPANSPQPNLILEVN